MLRRHDDRSTARVHASEMFSGDDMADPQIASTSWSSISFRESDDSKSYLAVCSSKGLEWIKARVGSSDQQIVENLISRLSSDLGHRSQLDCLKDRRQNPEPDMQSAWEYCQEYFENRAETMFGVVDQDDFELRLQAHFHASDTPPDDPNWYALRNMIYATGSRLALSRRGCEPNEVHSRAFQFFENALSVNLRILFTPQHDLMGVQALTLMSFFGESILGTGIESMLCSNAVRLAQALRLNQDNGIGRSSGPSADYLPSRIWWALYCYDKHLSLRDGRPSCIDDDDISRPPPTCGPTENPAKYNVFMQMISHAKINSAIYKRLYSASARRQTLEQEEAVMNELEERLLEWRDLLPAHLRPGMPIVPSNLPVGMHIDSAVYMHYAYYGATISLFHSFPWIDQHMDGTLTPLSHPTFSQRQDKATAAARNVILATSYIKPDLNTSGCLIFTYPLMSFIVLFLHVLQEPLAKSAHSDVVLMDMAAGHFAKLEIATSMQLDAQFIRDLVNIARRKVQECKKEVGHQNVLAGPVQTPRPEFSYSPTFTEGSIDFHDFVMYDDYVPLQLS